MPPVLSYLVGMQTVGYSFPEIGGKKLIYTHIQLPLTAIADFAALGKTDGRFKTPDALVKKNNGLWSAEAEAYLQENF